MNVRSLWPWLLGGGLLASALTNLSMYRSLNAAPVAPAFASHLDPGAVPSFHLAPTASTEHCPTLDLLGLTDGQSDQIRRCSLTSLDLRTDLAVEIHEATVEMRELLSESEVENERVLELADRIASLRSEQYKAWVGSILVVRDVLTPSQLELLHELESS